MSRWYPAHLFPDAGFPCVAWEALKLLTPRCWGDRHVPLIPPPTPGVELGSSRALVFLLLAFDVIPTEFHDVPYNLETAKFEPRVF
jgi:hypothetical protein